MSVISKIELPNGDLYNFKDEEAAREFVATSTSNTVVHIEDGIEMPFHTIAVNIPPVIESGAFVPIANSARVYHAQKYIDIGEIQNGYYAADGTPTSSGNLRRTKDFLSVVPSTEYTISLMPTNNTAIRIHEYDANQQWLRQVFTESLTSGEFYSGSFTTSSDAVYIKFSVPAYSQLSLYINGESYAENFATIDDTLYGGIWNVTDGTFTATKKIYTFTGSEWDGYFYTGTNANRCGFAIGDLVPGDNYDASVLPICTIGTGNEITNDQNGAWEVGMCSFYSGERFFFRYCFPTSVTTIAQAKQYLLDNNCSIAYELKDPIVYKLTEHHVMTLKGENYVWSTAGETTVKYYIPSDLSSAFKQNDAICALAMQNLADITAAIATLPTDTSGSTGLQYETGTWQPEADIARGDISFSGTHSQAPILIMLVDATNTIDTTTNTNISFYYSDPYKAFQAGYPYSDSALRYAQVYWTTRTTSTTSLTISGISVTNKSDVTATLNTANPQYWATAEGFRPYSNSTSRYWRAGRTYKWYAIWKAST